MNKFQLPIYYSNTNLINNNIKIDLELEKIYKSLFETDKISQLNIKNWCNNFTKNKEFLNDTQSLMEKDMDYSMNFINNTNNNDISNNKNNVSNTNILDIFNDIKNETGFIKKYNYLPYKHLTFLNRNKQFLEVYSLFNIGSPILFLLTPIIFLLIPLLIILSRGKRFTDYLKILRKVARNHIIGKLLNFNNSDTKIYTIISLLFFAFQIYGNVYSCIKNMSNLKLINERLNTIQKYIKETLINIDNYIYYTEDLKTYSDFLNVLKEHKCILQFVDKKLFNITNMKYNLSKVKEIGDIYKCYYEIYNDEDIVDTIEYTLYFNGYLKNLMSLREKINKKEINKCEFVKRKNKMINFYHPLFSLNETKEVVKNSMNIKKNVIITGPNASGKTTVLKSLLFNVIFSQQIGYGFYDKAFLEPYSHIYSYLNIPDTSDRDSLFQAEARRCREIITTIEKYKNDRHFCIFDELFSGTNPKEAVKCCTSMLKYLNNHNIDYIVTTHFTDLCENLKHVNKNLHMYVEKYNDEIIHSYKLEKGISKIEGGIIVLKELEFPEEILNEI